jgi:hypothetical protein
MQGRTSSETTAVGRCQGKGGKFDGKSIRKWDDDDDDDDEGLTFAGCCFRLWI